MIKKLINNDFSVVFFFDLIGKIIMGVETIFIIRILSEIDYAYYVNGTAIASIIFSIIGTGISIPFVAYSSEQIARGNKNVFSLYFICSIFMFCLSCLLMLFAPFFSSIYNVPIALCILSILYGAFQSLVKMNQSYFQACEKYKKSGIVLNIKNIIILCITISIYFAIREVDSTILISLAGIGTAFAFLIGFIWILRIKAETKIDFVGCVSIFKKMAKESAWLIIYLILQSLFSSLLLVIINIKGSSTDVSNYGVAMKYYNILMLFLASIQTVLRVKTSKPIFLESASYRKKYIIKWIKKTVLIAVPVAIVGIFFAPIVIPILNGGKYENAIIIFQILMIALALGYIFSACTVLMMGIKKYKMLVFLAIMSLASGSLFCFAMYDYIGVFAAAIGFIISNVILNISSFIIIFRGKDCGNNISYNPNF